MRILKTFQVIFTNNQIASVKEVNKPKIGFDHKYISRTRFHLIFAYIKAMSINRALKEAQKIVDEFLESQDSSASLLNRVQNE
jgi:hypothetical protein